MSTLDDRSTPPAGRASLRPAARLLAAAAAPERRHLWIAIAWLALAAGLEALGPLAGKVLIDRYLLPREAALGEIAALLLGALAAGLVASWLRYRQLLRLAGLAMRSVQRVREQVHAHVLRLPLAFFDRAITGQLVSRITNDTESVKALYVQVLFVMLDSVIVLAGAALAMLWLDWRLLGVVALLVPAVAGVVALYQRLSAPAVARTRALRSELNAHVAESIAGMAVLQATGATGRFADRFAQLNEAHYRSRRRELRANAWLLRPMLDLLNVLLLAALIGAFGLRSQGGALGAAEVGVLYAFMAYLARVVEPLTQITMQFAQLQQALVGAARVQALLEQPAEADQAGNAGADPIPHGAIAIQALDFAYQGGRPVLQDIALDLPAGSFTGIVGHTGSGKSTLLALLLRFYPARPAPCGWTARRSRRSARPCCARASAWCRRSPSCWRPRCARTSRWAATSRRRGSRPPRARPTRWASSRLWSAAGTPCWVKAARGCRPARSSCWRSPAHWPASRASCCSTRRPRTWTATPSRWCSARWRVCAARSPWWRSRTGCPPCARPTASWC
jgi:ATP-binding cassette subfamily B protein/ATP-binding cassette subfamily C protein/ATP-binding cassette subfamily B multidrug efflux pump